MFDLFTGGTGAEKKEECTNKISFHSKFLNIEVRGSQALDSAERLCLILGPMEQLRQIYRHPVKGFRPEELKEAFLDKRAGLVGDRSFAFQFMDEKVPENLRIQDAKTAAWMPKFHLLNQHDWPDLAKLGAKYDRNKKTLKISNEFSKSSIEAGTEAEKDRMALANYVESFLKNIAPFEKARHPEKTPLRLVGEEELKTRYTDGDKGPVSVVLLESLKNLESLYGFSVDPRRFRINLILEGAPAWTELGWAGKKISIGSSVLQLIKPIGRCPNIDVNPETGARENEIFSTMKEKLGHSFFGMRAEVVKEDKVETGNTWRLID